MTEFIKPVKTAKKTKAKKYTSSRVLFVLDKSSSMFRVKNETVDGFNAFLKEQQTFKQKATLTLAFFSDRDRFEYKHHRADLSLLEPLNYEEYTPTGWTALYDAVGRTITEALAEKTPKSCKTVLAILTDGEENSSREFNNSSVRSLIEKVQNEYDWEVIFVGANIDAAAVGSSIGVMRSKTASFNHTSKGMADVMKTASYASNASRGMDYEWMKGATLEGAGIKEDFFFASNADGTKTININSLHTVVDKGIDEKIKTTISTTTKK